MESKKISFGFSKINKKLNLNANKAAPKDANKVELIKCLEGQEIKLVEEKPKEVALVIPLKENQKTSTALASLIKRRAVLLGEDEPEVIKSEEDKNIVTNGSEDIEKRAARELLAELNTNDSLNSDTNLVLPVVHPDDLPLEGAKESSMDDYESIPIQEFGKAMLRGMGWVEPPKPTKGGPPVDEMPSVRPKGMGLGADKALKAKPLLVAPESNEILEIKRKAYVRILGGKHNDLYGQIEGFDDHAGRVIVKMAIGGAKEAFNEFLCQPVSRKEYAQYGKCINTNKYEEYKKKENEHGQIILKKEEIDKYSERYQQIKIEQVQLDKNTKVKKEIQYISSDEDQLHKHPKFKEEEVISRSHPQTDDRERQGNRDFESDSKRREYRDDGYLPKPGNRDNERRYRDDERLSSKQDKKPEYEDRRRGEDYERERNRDYYRNAYEKPRHRDDFKDAERPRERYANYDDREKSKDYRRRDDEAKERHRDYEERSSQRQRKPPSISDDSENADERSKHKKSSKDKKSKKKSKKSKKNKTKYNDSSDSESSSSASSSEDHAEEERRKRHKKKTKKSKKQRERSRSKGRRQ